jgi:outer membrane biosynthesis protein TonB
MDHRLHYLPAKVLVWIVLLLCTGVLVGFSQDVKQITLPRLIDVARPEYPDAAKKAGIGGEVFVTVLVDKKGRTKVVDSFGPLAPCEAPDDPLTLSVQTAAVEAAKKTTFAPATYNGKPVDKGFELRFVFDPFDGKPSADTVGTISSEPRSNWPVALKIPKANYPEVAGTIAGLTKVKMLIDESGRVVSAGALSGNRLLRRAAIKAACGASFRPATRDGKPIKFEYILEHNFYNVYIRG